MIISSPTMSRNAVAISVNSFGGIFRTSFASVHSNPAPMMPSRTRTIGDCSDVAMSNCAMPYPLTLPNAAGGLARPTMPATATIVRM